MDETAPEQRTDTPAGQPTESTPESPVTPAPATPTPVATTSPAPRSLPAKLVFRVPGSAYVPIAFVAMCMSFVGVAAPWLTVVFVIPLAAILYVARTRTEVDADKLVIRTVWSRTVLPWSRVASLRIVDRSWVRAVRTDGGEIALPSVRTRHLPAVALISRGRITDPTAPRT